MNRFRQGADCPIKQCHHVSLACLRMIVERHQVIMGRNNPQPLQCLGRKLFDQQPCKATFIFVRHPEVTTTTGDRQRGYEAMAISIFEATLHPGILPGAGVGLARMEFIISEHIGVHPMALVHPERISQTDGDHVATLAANFASPRDFFVRNLAEGAGTIAAAFHPRPVIIRLSDFKTNEYAQLLGGAAFEPHEANPMLGFRGASRYAHPANAEGFALECEALQRVRDDMGMVNLLIMVPFCRRVVEAECVLTAMVEHGLQRSRNGFQIYVMCEIPNNVIQVDAFPRYSTGFPSVRTT